MKGSSVTSVLTLLSAVNAASSIEPIAVSTNPPSVYLTPSDFLPRNLGTFASCTNGTNTTSGTASDIAILSALLETNVTLSMQKGLYAQVAVPANGSVSFVLGSINATLSFPVTLPVANTTVGYNYVFDMLDTVRLCCAVSGYQYCDGGMTINLGVAEESVGGTWMLGMNVSSSGASPLTVN